MLRIEVVRKRDSTYEIKGQYTQPTQRDSKGLLTSEMPITPPEAICSNDTNKSHLYGVCCRFHLDDLADEFINAMSDSTQGE